MKPTTLVMPHNRITPMPSETIYRLILILGQLLCLPLNLKTVNEKSNERVTVRWERLSAANGSGQSSRVFGAVHNTTNSLKTAAKMLNIVHEQSFSERRSPSKLVLP